MKIARTLKALLIGTVLALSLFAASGTAWAEDAGISWEQIPVAPDPLAVGF